MKKRARILTNRNFPDGKSVEYIEVDEQGRFFWRAVDYSYALEIITTDDVSSFREIIAECCFSVDLEFVKEKFIECGREYKDS